MYRKRFMRSSRRLRGVYALGIVVFCSACHRAPGAENKGDRTANAAPIKRAVPLAQSPTKPGRAPAKRMAHNATTGAAPVRRSDEREAAAPNEAVVQSPINTPPPISSVAEL